MLTVVKMLCSCEWSQISRVGMGPAACGGACSAHFSARQDPKPPFCVMHTTSNGSVSLGLMFSEEGGLTVSSLSPSALPYAVAYLKSSSGQSLRCSQWTGMFIHPLSAETGNNKHFLCHKPIKDMRCWSFCVVLKHSELYLNRIGLWAWNLEISKTLLRNLPGFAAVAHAPSPVP